MSAPEDGSRASSLQRIGSAPSQRCAACQAEIAPALLACPLCAALIHREALESSARAASAALARNEPSLALAEWRRALSLLPPDSRQHRKILETIQTLSEKIDRGGEHSSAAQVAPAGARPQKSKSLWAVVLSGVSVVLLKLKALAPLLLGILKPLGLGLTKLSTVASMLLSLGVYWTAFGWQFAAGLIACTYVHEIGHVVALRRFGIAASAPMFVPGFGALVRLKQYPTDAREDAVVGLAGPRWGLGASLSSLGLGLALHSGAFLAIAHVNAWINLFNLLPVWTLDGARGVRPLNSLQRRLLSAVLLVLFLLTHEAMFAIIAAVALWRSFERSKEAGHVRTLLEFSALAALLAGVLLAAGKVR